MTEWCEYPYRGGECMIADGVMMQGTLTEFCVVCITVMYLADWGRRLWNEERKWRELKR